MGRLVSGIGTLLGAALLALLLASPTSASDPVVDLVACDGAAVVVTGASATVSGPTFLSTNKGIVEDFLTSNTTTLTAGGVATNANAGWSAPVESVDPALGTVWSTSWLRTVAAPPVGVPVAVGLEVVLAHDIPDLTVPPKQRPVKFTAGLWSSATCTLVTGQAVTATTGGTVTTGDGRLSLAVPAAATAGDTTIVVTPSSAKPPATLGTAVSATYELGPSGTTFARPATVTIAFDPARLPANTGRALHVVAESNGVWSLLPSTVDLARGTVSAAVRHFTLFGVTATPGYQVIGGRVTSDATGTPIAGVDVRVRDVAIAPPSPPVATVSTDLSGEWAVLVPDSGTYKVRFFTAPPTPYAGEWAHDSLTLAGGTSFAVSGADVVVDEGLADGYFVSGRVLDAAGAAVADAFVSAQQLPGGACCTFVAGASTDAAGAYTIVVPAGSYKVMYSPPAGSSLMTRWYPNGAHSGQGDFVAVDATTSPVVLSDVTLPQAYRISGTVVAAGTTTPLGGVGVGVNVAPTDPSSCCEGVAGGQSVGDGTFSFLVPAGSYILNFGGGGSSYVQRWYDGASGTPDHRFALPISVTTADVTGLQLPATLGYRISGHVSLTGGAPARRVGVHAPNPDGSGGCGGGCGGTNDNGDFDFAILPGTWIIRFDPQQTNQLLGTTYLAGYWNGASSPTGATVINAAAGGSLGGLNATLVSGFRISGRVSDATTGMGIAGVFVNANDAATTPQQCCPAPAGGAATDGSGGYSFVVPAGSYKLFFNAFQTDYLSAWFDGTTSGARDISAALAFSVDADRTIDQQLTLGVRLSGQVLNEAGVGLPYVNVGVQRDLPGGGCCEGVGGVPTDANGVFSLVVPAGQYKVQANPSAQTPGTYAGRWWRDSATPGSADLLDTASADAQNLVIVLPAGYRVSGRVTDATGGGIAGVYVNANDAASVCCPNPVAGAFTDGDGRYSLVVTAGTYKILCNAWQTAYETRFWSSSDPGGTADVGGASDLAVGADVADVNVALALR